MNVKKPLLLLFVLAFLLVGCQHKDNNKNNYSLDHREIPHDTLSIKNNKDYSDSQNDLVYRDYGTGVHLSTISSLTIPNLNLELKDNETAMICAVNLETYEVYEISNYQPNQKITFSPITDGVYQLVAVISSGEYRDLTPDAFVATTNETKENPNAGFILLQ